MSSYNAPDITLLLIQAREVEVTVHPTPEGKNDACIDDMFGAAL